MLQIHHPAGLERRPTIGFPIVVATLMLAACTGPGRLRTPPPPEIDDLSAFHRAWESYADEVNGLERQRDCMPRFVPADADLERRGAVVMFHGFSGCPQQFFSLAARAAENGYDVLLPLHPGHGLMMHTDESDDLSRLPRADDDRNRYADLAMQMNDIMALSPGEKIAVGFSLGGTIALNAGLTAPDLYDRLLLLSPMLAIRGGGFIEGLAGTIGRVPGFRNLIVKTESSRELCDGWQADGRAGFCDYRFKDIIALLGLKEINQTLYDERAPKLPIQIVAAGNEKYVSNKQIAKLVERQSLNGPISFCILPSDVPHEMLSPYENKGQPMYWLENLIKSALDFFADGIFFATEPVAEEANTIGPACLLKLPQAHRESVSD